MTAAGRRPGIIRGVAGTTPGITIPGGTGTIRSTIPLGMAGVIRTIILHGMDLCTLVPYILAAAIVVARSTVPVSPIIRTRRLSVVTT